MLNAGDKPVIVQAIYANEISIVWGAITEVERMRRWFFNNIPDFKPEIGFQTGFVIENDGRIFPHLWRIVNVVPEKLITYDWSYDGYPGRSKVTFELEPAEPGTALTLTNEILESFPEDIPEFRRSACLAGWDHFITNSLPKYLARLD